MSKADQGDYDLFAREAQLRAAAGQVMKELRERGEDWQAACRDHPVAKAYRELLKDAWRRPVKNGYPRPVSRP